MDMERWLQLSLERDEHLLNAQSALRALENLPPGAGLVRHCLQSVLTREANLAQLALILMDTMNQPSKWKG